MIRPERVIVEAHGASGENRIPGMVEHAIFVGAATELHVRIPGGAVLKAQLPNDGTRAELPQGTPVVLHLPADALRVLRPAVEADAAGESEPAAPAAVDR